MIRAVLFDLGDTLITSRGTLETFKAILHEKGVEVSLDDLAVAYERATAKFVSQRKDRRPPGARDFNEVYSEWNAAIVKELGLKKRGLGNYINERWFQVVGLQAYEDTVPVLGRLSAMGLRLGIVTNGYREEVDEILGIVGGSLKPSMFGVIVGRDTAEASKPDPRPFLHAAGALGLRPDEVMFVGDRYDKDYVGSQGAGMVPVLLLRGRRPPAEAPDNITKIQTLDELVGLIR